MLLKNKIQNIHNILDKNFLVPFSLSISTLIFTIYFCKVEFMFLNRSLILYIGLIFIFFTFSTWFKRLNEKSKLKKTILEFSKTLFFVSFLLIALFNLDFLIKFNLPQNTISILILLTISSGFVTFYKTNKTKVIVASTNKDLLDEEARSKEFSTKFPTITKIPILKYIIKWMYKEDWFYSVSLIFVTLAFLGFGLIHLGQFMSVDEPKWVNTRVPQLFQALEEGAWSETYINDKPGVLPAFLSGAVNIFLDHDTYKSNPLEYEKYLFFWRLPILLFNFLMLFFIYHFVKKLLGKNHSLLITGLIALNPIIIGISQIVNPDATLWSVGFLSFITFFLYLKTDYKKYIYYSGLFLGLALISKYFASIFYILFFIIIYLNYLFKHGNKDKFFNHFFNTLLLYLISIATYTLLFPATWIKTFLIFRGTINSTLLNSGIQYFYIFLFIVIFEIIFLKGKITNYLKNKLNIVKTLIYFLSFLLTFIFIILIINIIFNNLFFDFNKYFFVSERGNLNLIKDTLSSFYIILFSLSLPLLFGVLFSLPVFAMKKIKWDQQLLITSSFLLIFIFIIGASIGGYTAGTRYQILLYPIYTIITSFTINLIFNCNKKMIVSILTASLLIVILNIPFYYHYNNFLNFKNYTTTEAWGYGGYEIAQKLNSLPKAKDLIIWSDREGTNNFFIGKSYWRGTDNPFNKEKEIDYLVLTKGGEKIFQRALVSYNEGKRYLYAKVSGETPLLDYYEKKPEYKVCIQNNLNNCVWIVKIKNN